GGRSRPTHDSGAARAQLALDDADLLARRRPPPAPRLRPLASSVVESSRERTLFARARDGHSPRPLLGGALPSSLDDDDSPLGRTCLGRERADSAPNGSPPAVQAAAATQAIGSAPRNQAGDGSSGQRP